MISVIVSFRFIVKYFELGFFYKLELGFFVEVYSVDISVIWGLL